MEHHHYSGNDPYGMRPYKSKIETIIDGFHASGSPRPLVEACINAIVGALAQCTINVKRHDGHIISPGRSGLGISRSGTGKSYLYDKAVGPIVEAWDEADWIGQPFLKPDLFHNDSTGEAFLDRLNVWNSVFAASDEGEVLTPLVTRREHLLTQAADGSHIQHARRGLGRISVKHPRLSFLALVQTEHSPLVRYLVNSSVKGLGFGNRVAVRVVYEKDVMPPQAHAGDMHLKLWRDCVKPMATAALETAKFQTQHSKITLHAHPHGYQFMAGVTNQAKSTSCQPEFAVATNYLARSPDRIYSNAAARHLLEHGPEGEIAVSTLEEAFNEDVRCFQDFMHLQYEPPKISKAMANAARLVEVLARFAAPGHATYYTVADMQREARNAGLTSGQFGAALPLLCAARLTKILMINSKECLELSPFLRLNPPLPNS